MRHGSTEPSGTLYRALVTTRYEYADGSDPQVHTVAYGPYSTKAPATRALTIHSHPQRQYGQGVTREATGHVEQSHVIWIPEVK